MGNGWVDRRCCDWDTFLDSLLAAARRTGFPILLVDRCEARRYWRRHSCTGAEVIRMQHAREADAALYNGIGEPPVAGDGGGGDRPSPSPDRPLPVSPSALA